MVDLLCVQCLDMYNSHFTLYDILNYIYDKKRRLLLSDFDYNVVSDYAISLFRSKGVKFDV